MNINHSLQYRPDIDGLRALAVLPVVLFHANLGFPGGFVGVDVFFVISGFLITSIIARDIKKGTFSMPYFWERRIRRIFPAAAVLTLVTLIAGAFILLPGQLEDLGKASVAQMFMVSNFYFWQQDGYFAGPSDFEPILHTWSLAVEEQFYFIFPILLVLLYKKISSSGVIRSLLMVLLLASLALSIYGVHHFPTPTFYLLPARAWELLIGALVALTPVTQKPRWLSELCGFLGIGFILTAMFTLDKASPFPGVAAILPCVGTALFIFAGQNQVGIAGKILSASPLVFCGKISYSLYLWHWPLLVYANHLAAREASVTVRIILVVASIILAIASWRWVETPFRTKSLFGERKKLFKFFYISTASLVLLAAAIYYSKGIPQRLNESQRIVNEAIEEDSPIKDTKGILKGEPLPSILPDAPPAATLVWGDSHTSVLVTPLRDLCKTYNTNMYCATRASHPPLLDVSLYPREKDVAGFNDKVMAFIDEKKIKHVILCARWSFYASGKFPGQEKSHMRDREHSDTPQAEVFEKHFALTISKLRERGIRVWVLQQIPFHYRSPPELIFHGMRFGRSLNELGSTISEHEERQKHPNSVFANTEGITVIDPLQVFATNTEHCRIESDGKSLYRDEDHLTMFGSRMLIPLLTPIFEEIAPRSAP